MLRRLLSSLKSRASAPERDETASFDVEGTLDEARLRDQQLRNQAAVAIGQKTVLQTRIRETAKEIGEARALASRALVEAGDARAVGDEEGVSAWSREAHAQAARIRAAEGDRASLRSRYREVSTHAEETRRAIDENAMGLRALSSGSQEMAEVVEQLVNVMSTTIEDVTPTPEALDDEIEILEAEAAAGAPARGSSALGEKERRGGVETAAADSGLEALRAELGL